VIKNNKGLVDYTGDNEAMQLLEGTNRQELLNMMGYEPFVSFMGDLIHTCNMFIRKADSKKKRSRTEGLNALTFLADSIVNRHLVKISKYAKTVDIRFKPNRYGFEPFTLEICFRSKNGSDIITLYLPNMELGGGILSLAEILTLSDTRRPINYFINNYPVTETFNFKIRMFMRSDNLEHVRFYADVMGRSYQGFICSTLMSIYTNFLSCMYGKHDNYSDVDLLKEMLAESDIDNLITYAGRESECLIDGEYTVIHTNKGRMWCKVLPSSDYFIGTTSENIDVIIPIITSAELTKLKLHMKFFKNPVLKEVYDKVSKLAELYYEGNDAEHGINHVNEVLYKALDMNRKQSLGVDETHIIKAAMFHDICATSHRKDHEIKGGEVYLTKIALEYFITESRFESETIANAIVQHRGSYKGEFTSTLAELINAADRDSPILSDCISRVYSCATDDKLVFNTDIDTSKIDPMYKDKVATALRNLDTFKNNNIKKAIRRTYLHLLEKYSRVGYGRRNAIYIEYWKDHLEAFYTEIDELTVATLMQKLYALGFKSIKYYDVPGLKDVIKRCDGDTVTAMQHIFRKRIDIATNAAFNPQF